MQNKVVEITLTGSVPSKKNSRVRTRSGDYIPQKAFYDWQDNAIKELRTQTRERGLTGVSVEVIIYFGTRGRADLDNRLTSILDMLVEALVLRDDKWQDVPLMQVQADHRPRNPGAFIRITELSPE